MGWELSDTLETALVLDAVRSTTEHFGIPVILNSDQGSQLTDTEYKELLRSMNIRQRPSIRTASLPPTLIERRRPVESAAVRVRWSQNTVEEAPSRPDSITDHCALSRLNHFAEAGSVRICFG